MNEAARRHAAGIHQGEGRLDELEDALELTSAGAAAEAERRDGKATVVGADTKAPVATASQETESAYL